MSNTVTPAHTLPDALNAYAPLILDGAMGTMLQGYGLSEDDYRGTSAKSHEAQQQAWHTLHIAAADAPLQRGNNDMLCLTRPDIVADVHKRYLQAGAHIISTNTFNAQRISLADYGCEHLVRDINLAAARLARTAADAAGGIHFVAGSVGPTSKSLSMSPDISDPALRAITFTQLAEAYAEQMQALIEGGVDALLIETIFDTLNAKAATYAAHEAMQAAGRQVPLMLSATISDKAGRLLSGQTLDAFVTSIAHARPLSIGLNCSFGAKEMVPHLRALRKAAEGMDVHISIHPNAGLPNALGQYDETPELMVKHLQPVLSEGLASIIGGCCGTTDAHIRALADTVASQPQCHVKPPSTGAFSHAFQLSGLERLTLTPETAFINVGERCNVAGSRQFLRLIREKRYDEACTIARRQVEDGALVLDINMDDALLDTQAEMCHFLRLLAADPDICRVPFMVDSSKWDVIEAALGCIQGKAIVNSISLKEGETLFIEHARTLRRMGAAVVVMAFDEEGQATTLERRIAICQRAYRLLTEQALFPAEDIIFDPNVLAIATGIAEHDGYARDFILATRWIREHLHGSHISGGVSNLSFSFRGNNYLRQAMHAVFLYHARRAGMDMAIVNPASSVTYADIPETHLKVIEDAILARTADAAEHLVVLAEQLSNGTTAPAAGTAVQEAAQSVAMTVEQRLMEALRQGRTDTLEADIAEALTLYPTPTAIIEGPLMEGMNRVGQLFAEGKMFLPQVVKTARTMKQAVALLEPALLAHKHEHAQASATRQPRLLIATVKGDVHDIGKNIVATVMACAGYEVTDLGVMVTADEIVAQALAQKPDVIGLSGLITPSLEEMIHTVRALSEAGITVPVVIGGATTSALHTALKIAPAYGGTVVYASDASQNVPLVSPLMDAATATEAARRIAEQQAALRLSASTEAGAPTASIAEARAQAKRYF